MKEIKRCKDCSWLSKVIVDNFAYCHYHKTDVWIMSVGCSQLDDTEVF